MIQAVNTDKNLAKALLGTQGKANAKSAQGAEGASDVDPELMLENADFANELAASLSGEEMLVQPVAVDPTQALQNPSALINLPEAGQPESVSPKIFDPSLTQGVEKLIQPKTTQIPGNIPMVDGMPVVEGAPVEIDPEIAQAMLKTPQVQMTGGRSPAIDFAQSEVDPQLMNMEDFVAQKNMANKKSAHTSAYGMNKSPLHKLAMESGLKSTQMVGEAASLDSGAAGSGSMNSQQFLLGLNADQSGAPMSNEVTHAPVKTFDMSQIKTSNADQIMTQITDYIVQAKAAKEPTVNMRVNHDDLGMIDITVQKSMSAPGLADTIAINIGTHTADGKNFFQMNSKDLFSHLTNAGLSVSELKVETPSQTAKNEFDFNGNSRSGYGSSDKQYGSESNQRKHESDRRQELWDLLKDKEAA